MGDVDVLAMLFDGDNGILGLDSSSKRTLGTTTTSVDNSFTGQPFHSKGMDMSLMAGDGGIEDDWPSSLLSGSLDGIDNNDFFNALMETNLPDYVKQAQQHPQYQQPQQKQVSDHDYSISPSSPHSDSGVSSAGPYSPSNSSGIEDLAFDIDRDLFGPLDLKNYDDVDGDMVGGVDPMLLDSISECSSDSPALAGNESPARFDFDDLTNNHSVQPGVQGLTISTDETTKVIKVLSVNGSSRSQTVHHISSLPSKQKSVTSGSAYPELMLSDEEKDLLSKEGICLPTHLPLTRDEEKVLRSVRRRIRNKASARNSRRKKQDYMEALETRVKHCTNEKRQLEKKVIDLEKRNSSLIGQLKKLQKLVTDGTRQTAKTGTCAMILALSFALVVLPNYRSLVGTNDSSQDTLMKAPTEVGGRPARSLLSKAEEYMQPAPHTHKSFNHIPFVNYNNMPSLVSPAKQLIDEPIDGEREYAHDPIDDMVNMKRGVVSSSFGDVDEKVIHMEITKLPDTPSTATVDHVNKTAGGEKNIVAEDAMRQRHSQMDLGDEL